ncbi:hypothetical protein ACWCQL_37035 [Streptomyces sp. NPDC002073]
MRVSPAIAFLALLVGLTACSGGGSDARPVPTATHPVSKPPAGGQKGLAAASFSVNATVDTATAIRVVNGSMPYQHRFTSVTKLTGDRNAIALDLTSNGRLITSSAPDATSVDGVLQLTQARVGLQGPDGFTPFPKPDKQACAGHGPRQVPYAQERNGVVVWTETATTNLSYFDWCVFRHDPKYHRTDLLGDSDSLTHGKQLREAAGTSAVTLGTTRAYWATTYPLREKDQFGTKVLAASLTGDPRIETAVDHAKLPRATADSLFYVRSADVSQGFPKNRFEIHRIGADRHDRIVASGALAPQQLVSTLAVTDERVSWVVATAAGDSSTLYSLHLPTNKALTIPLAHAGGTDMFLRATDRLLAWGGTDGGDAGQYAYDLKQGKLWKVGEQQGYSVIYTAGDYLAWAKVPTPTGRAVYNVAQWK